MLLKNIVKFRVGSSIDDIPTLDNFYLKNKNSKNRKVHKLKKGYYGVAANYIHTANDGNGSGTSEDGTAPEADGVSSE